MGSDRFADTAVFQVQRTLVSQLWTHRGPHLGGRTLFGHDEVEEAVGLFAARLAVGSDEFAEKSELDMYRASEVATVPG